MHWPGRGKVPDDVRHAAGLGSGERVLAAATTADGDTLLATAERLLLVTHEELRWGHPWSHVETAGWDGEAGILDLRWLDGSATLVDLGDGAGPRLPEVVRERVESSVVTSQRVEVAGRGGARLVVRRAGDGLRLQVVPDAGTRLDDPAVAAAVERAWRELADQVGAPPGERT